MAESSPRMPQELLSDANQGIIRGPKPLQQHASHKAGMDIIGSSQQAVAALDKSPVKSPSKARRQLPVLSVDTARQLDDEDDAPDSTRANDQREQRQAPHLQPPSSAAASVPPVAAATAPAAAADDGKRNKYIQLLNHASANGLIQGKSKLPSSTGSSSTSSVMNAPAAGDPAAAAVAATKPAAASAAGRAATATHKNTSIGAGSNSSSVPQLLQSAGLAAKTTPIARGSRSRASILDSSPGGSLIPTSPAAAATTGPPSPPVVSRLPGSAGISSSGSASCIAASPSKRPDWRMPAKPVGQDAAANAAGPAAAAGSPARRSLAAPAAAAARPQYAFGSRIEAPAAASTRKPSPMRQSAPGAVRHVSSSSPSGPSPGSAAARAYASPQRVPAAARSAGGLPAAATGRAGASPQRVPAGARSSATATGTAATRAGVSPQRVPAAARSAAAASAAMRSTSAPRMSADKLQSRFTQHQVSAAAAQRSKTPNPAARAAAAAGGAASGTTPGSRARASTSSVLASSSSAQSRHMARMRGSDAAASSSSTATGNRCASPASRVPGARSPASSPGTAAMRAATRSLPSAAGAFGSGSKASSSGAGSPTKLKPVAPAGQRAAGPRLPALTAATGGSSSSNAKALAGSSAMGIPTLQDRYRSGHKHTPAAVAVAEARATAATGAAAASSCSASSTAAAVRPVPKLSLGGLLGSSPATPGLLRTREQEDNSCTPLVALPLPPGKAGAAAKLEQESSSSSVASPFLGRISNMSAVASPPGPTTLPAHKQQQAAAQCTPQQQRRSLLPMHPAPGTPIPPAPAGTPAGNAANVRLPDVDFSSTPLVAGKGSAGSVASAVAAAAAGDMAPPLLPREVSGASLAYGDGSLSREASRDVTRETSMHALHGAAGLSREGSAVSIDSAAVAVAAKGLMLPLHRLEEEEASAQFASPPRHRRGEHSSPKGAAAVCSQLLKSKASSVCGGSGSKPTPAEAAAADDAAATPAAAQQQQRTNKGSMAAPLMATPASSSPSKALRFTPGSEFKLRSSLAKVPRLDLTPVLAQAEEDQQLEEEQQQLQLEQECQDQQLAEEQQHEQQLLLEFSGHAEEQAHRSRARAGANDGKPESASSGAGKRGTSAGRRAAGSGKRSAAAEPPPQPESFYVYESVMPAEETKTYEELRRALLKSHGGHRLAANLQGIWGCYQDARRNTEAMAFRGHRLLDQVSNEYKHYKSEAEQHLEQLQQERDAYKEELQLALTTGHGSGMDVEVAKDKQVQELRHENQQLRLQMAEMEKALHKAAEFHHAQQAEAVPNQARTIAGSATTSILFQQTLALQEELMAKEKTIEDLKAGLMITCGALKQTNYMEPEGAVRAGLEPDTVQVLDMMISSTAAEASMLDQVHAAAAAAAEAVQPHTQIEELH
uniref:Uncharacterized protein n=1 Tax=Tetradesmus obliquus TaxID=3088 RepID=A0A383V5N7_TETOB|eukprot:jgi/Sobl393_1/8703/SZX60918.1